MAMFIAKRTAGALKATLRRVELAEASPFGAPLNRILKDKHP